MGQQCCAVDDKPNTQPKRKGESHRETRTTQRPAQDKVDERYRERPQPPSQKPKSTPQHREDDGCKSSPLGDPHRSYLPQTAVDLFDLAVSEPPLSTAPSARLGLMDSDSGRIPLERTDTVSPSQMRRKQTEESNAILPPTAAVVEPPQLSVEEYPSDETPTPAAASVEEVPKTVDPHQSSTDATSKPIQGLEEAQEPSQAAVVEHRNPNTQKANKYAVSLPDSDSEPTPPASAPPKLTIHETTTRNRKFQFAPISMFPQQMDFAPSDDGEVFQFAPTNLFQQRIGSLVSQTKTNPFSGFMKPPSDDSSDESGDSDDGIIGMDDAKDNEASGPFSPAQAENDERGNPEASDSKTSNSNPETTVTPQPLDTTSEANDAEQSRHLEPNQKTEEHTVEVIVPETIETKDGRRVEEVAESSDGGRDEADSALYGPQPLLRGFTGDDVLKADWFKHQNVDPPRILWSQTDKTIELRVEPANVSSGWEIIDLFDELATRYGKEKCERVCATLDRLRLDKSSVGRIVEISCEDKGIPIRVVLPLLEPVRHCTFSLVTNHSAVEGVVDGPPYLKITAVKVPCRFHTALSQAVPSSAKRVDSDGDSGSDVESDSSVEETYNQWPQLLEVNQRTYLKLNWIKEVLTDGATEVPEYTYQGIYREGFQDAALFDDDDAGFHDGGGFSDDD